MSQARSLRAVLHRLRSTTTVAPAPPPELPDFLQRDSLDGGHMRRLIAFLLGPEDNCIDVGANEGSLLAEMVRVAPRGTHVAFEPIPHLARSLAERFPAVEVREAAASDHDGTSTFAHVRAAEGWSGLKFRPLPTGDDGDVVQLTVRLVPIDDVVDPARPIALVKIDVEGAEQQVIEGAMRTLRTHKPTVLFEHGLGSANEFGTEPDDIHRLLTDTVGYRIFDLDGNGPYPVEEFRRTYYAAERVNFVAHH